MSSNRNDINDKKPDSEQAKKTRTQIIVILCIAALIIALASAVIFDKNQIENEKDKQAEKISEEISKQLDQNQKNAAEIKKNQEELRNDILEKKSGSDASIDSQNSYVIGSYKCIGYDNEVVIELHEDNTISVVSSELKGWWLIKKIDNISFMVMVFENSEEPEYFQVYGSRLIDTRSIYTGDVTIGSNFDSTLSMGDMTLTLKKNGKVEGRHRTSLDDGSGNYYTEAYGGSYTVDGEYIDINLSGDTTRFLMFDYNDSTGTSGIASLYYEKIS